jgi:hypothetical protein
VFALFLYSGHVRLSRFVVLSVPRVLHLIKKNVFTPHYALVSTTIVTMAYRTVFIPTRGFRPGVLTSCKKKKYRKWVLYSVEKRGGSMTPDVTVGGGGGTDEFKLYILTSISFRRPTSPLHLLTDSFIFTHSFYPTSRCKPDSWDTFKRFDLCVFPVFHEITKRHDCSLSVHGSFPHSQK